MTILSPRIAKIFVSEKQKIFTRNWRELSENVTSSKTGSDVSKFSTSPNFIMFGCTEFDSTTSLKNVNFMSLAQSELPRPIKIRPRMYVRRSIMYEKAAFCSPEEYCSVGR